MRALDTNVLARWLLGDDAAQSRLAGDLLSEPAWISHTVLLELGWVLGKAIGLPRATVADMMQQILDLDTAMIDRRASVAWAAECYRAGADWGDVMHLVSAFADAAVFTTFDLSLQRSAPAAPVAIETLRA